MRNVAATTMCAVLLSSCSSTGDDAVGSNPHTSTSAKPEITQMSPALLVGRESFPLNASGVWSEPRLYAQSYRRISADPQECVAIVGGLNRVPHEADSIALASMRADGGRSFDFRLALTLPSNRDLPDWPAVVDKCRSVSVEGDRYAVQNLPVDGVPSWAAAAQITDDNPQSRYFNEKSYVILATVRGLVVAVQLRRPPRPSTDDLSAAVKVFNDQIAKLEAAPA